MCVATGKLLRIVASLILGILERILVCISQKTILCNSKNKWSPISVIKYKNNLKASQKLLREINAQLY